MAHCFVIQNLMNRTFHTIKKDDKPAIISFSTVVQARSFNKLVNDMRKEKLQIFVTKKMELNTLARAANLSCLDVLLLEENNTYVLYPATTVETLHYGEYIFYLENKFN